MESPKPQKNIARTVTIVVVVLACSLLLVAFGIVIIPNLGRFSIPEAPEGYRYSGIASEELQAEAKKLILDAESSSGCETIALTMVEVLNLPQDVIDASWGEVWRMDVCGEEHTYAVTFSPDPAGGINVEILRFEE